jgi:hypothetical protein
MEERVFVPVRWEHIDEVRALIERLGSKAVTDVEAVEDIEAVEDRNELLHRVYKGCSEPTQRVLLYLAERPGDWILGIDLAEKAAQQDNNNVSPQMRSLGSAAARHHLTALPVKAKRRHDRLFLFMMPREDAEIIQGFAS